MKQQLGDKVAKVQISKRLASSPCVLVSGKFGWSANMERYTDYNTFYAQAVQYFVLWVWLYVISSFRLMKAQTLGDTSSLEFMRGRRIMEINADHPIVKDLHVSLFSWVSSRGMKEKLMEHIISYKHIGSSNIKFDFCPSGYPPLFLRCGDVWGRYENWHHYFSNSCPKSWKLAKGAFLSLYFLTHTIFEGYCSLSVSLECWY